MGGDPPSPSHFIWVSDGGVLYPGALASRSPVPLSQWILVRAKDATEVWKVGLEAIQTGLFVGAFLRPTKACPASHLRRLQLSAERTKTQVFLLCQAALPHWMLKTVVNIGEVGAADGAKNTLPKERIAAGKSRGSEFQSYPNRKLVSVS